MATEVSYEKISSDADECLNTLVRLLARLIAKEQIEKQKSLNTGRDNKPEK